MSKVKTTEEMLEKIKKIPKGTLGVESGKGIVETGIKIFHILRIIIIAIVNKQLSILLAIKVFKALLAFMVNHVFIYLNNGDYVTIDAMPQGIIKGDLIKKIESGVKIRMYYNNNATEEGFEVAKDWICKQLGEAYSYQDFAAFVGRLITAVLPKTPVIIENNTKLEHCSEISVKFWDIMFTKEIGKVSDKIVPNIKIRDNIHPQDIENYFNSKEALDNGWVKVFDNSK